MSRISILLFLLTGLRAEATSLPAFLYTNSKVTRSNVTPHAIVEIEDGIPQVRDTESGLLDQPIQVEDIDLAINLGALLDGLPIHIQRSRSGGGNRSIARLKQTDDAVTVHAFLPAQDPAVITAVKVKLDTWDPTIGADGVLLARPMDRTIDLMKEKIGSTSLSRDSATRVGIELGDPSGRNFSDGTPRRRIVAAWAVSTETGYPGVVLDEDFQRARSGAKIRILLLPPHILRIPDTNEDWSSWQNNAIPERIASELDGGFHFEVNSRSGPQVLRIPTLERTLAGQTENHIVAAVASIRARDLRLSRGTTLDDLRRAIRRWKWPMLRSKEPASSAILNEFLFHYCVRSRRLPTGSIP